MPAPFRRCRQSPSLRQRVRALRQVRCSKTVATKAESAIHLSAATASDRSAMTSSLSSIPNDGVRRRRLTAPSAAIAAAFVRTLCRRYADCGRRLHRHRQHRQQACRAADRAALDRQQTAARRRRCRTPQGFAPYVLGGMILSAASDAICFAERRAADRHRRADRSTTTPCAFSWPMMFLCRSAPQRASSLIIRGIR